jgi:competence protein ComEA
MLNRDRYPISVQERPGSVQGTDGRLDINTASADQLMTLPGIGEKLAQSIIDYRSIHGPFTRIGQLLQIEGLGAGKLDGILDLITVGG